MNILIVVTSTAHYTSGLETGLWLSELTHIYEATKKQGYEVSVVSIKGGNVPIDPESLKPLVLDAVTKKLWSNDLFREELRNTKSLTEVSDKEFDLVYLAGGHGSMYDFPENQALQLIIQKHFENGKKIAAICHGVGGLLNVKLSDGSYLISGKKVTGFDWFEELIARRRKEVPFNLERALKNRKVVYIKALIPMTSQVIVGDNLITGQNPFSSKEMADVVLTELKTLR